MIGKQACEIRVAEIRARGDWSVNFENGREVSRDRGDRFTWFAGDVIWGSAPAKPA